MRRRTGLIGVTPWYDNDKGVTYIKNGYLEGIGEAGGIGVLLPLTTNKDQLERIVNGFDGFLISGGPDVDPKHYGERSMPCNGEIAPDRDWMEMYIIRKAIEDNIPVLGICRGIQVMNVALGGTLYQDIYVQSDSRQLVKHSQEAPKWYPTHEICIEEGSRIFHSFRNHHRMAVNSYHHQAVKDVASKFKVTSSSVDGIIESIEHTEHPFAVGVQWHPELMWQKDSIHLGIFTDFVDACINTANRG